MSRRRPRPAAPARRGLWLALLAAWPGVAQAQPRRASADFAAQPASDDVRRLADWVVDSDDTHGRPFAIVDKVRAQVLAFDARGRLVGATPALLGLAHGDASAPGIGTLRLAQIAPVQRITPAGRFEAHLGTNLAGKGILWVDYDSAISLHPVVVTNAAERRLQRLATPSTLDNRISYGCINVPAAFYEGVIQPLFTPADGIVYILPESRPFSDLFALRPAEQTASQGN